MMAVVFYEKMSLYKNLLIYAKLYGLKSDRVVQVLQQVGLADAKDVIAEKTIYRNETTNVLGSCSSECS